MASNELRKPKRKSFNDPGHAHELTCSCFKKQTFLKSENAKTMLASAINNARIKYQFDIWAWVFMPEHFHMMIFPRLEIYSISDILKAIKQPVAQKMVNLLKEKNPKALRYLETGLASPRYRFWQDGGGYDRNYWKAEEIRIQVDYIHNNPVKRGLVESAIEYEWSSAREWLTGEISMIHIKRESFPI